MLAPLVGSVAGAASLHIDDFQSPGTSGWTGGSFGGQGLARPADGGPTGDGDSFLQLQTSASHLATHNSTANWTGDFAAVDAARLTVDLRNAVGSDPLAMRVVLFGPTSTNQRWTSSAPISVPADGVWRNYEFSLAEDALSLVQGVATYDALLSSVVRVMLRHDAGGASAGGQNATATLGVDNIRLAAAPLPGDYDGNGSVGPEDYAVWSAAYGVIGPHAADGNADGAVDAADYTLWRDAAGASGAVAAPAPSSVLLLVGALVGPLGWRRSARRSLAEMPDCRQLTSL